MADRSTRSTPPVRVLGIAGSLRRNSFNRWLLEAARELAPPGMEIEVFDLSDIPLYNADIDTNEARPESVRRLKQAVADADALLIATPEYNHSVPGVLQNAIDWASRPAGRSPMRENPVGIIGASPGAIGTARAQQALKLVLLSTMSYVLPHPGITVGNAATKFDGSGRLEDEPTREFLGSFLVELRRFAERFRAPVAAARTRSAA